jgi:hypothetical protein
MSDRTPEQILADWRESERRYAEDPTPDLARRIDQLRLEHAAAVEARHVQAEELADMNPVRSA